MHVSVTAVTVCDSISLRARRYPPISSGNARDNVDGVSVDGRSIRVDGDRTTVFVTPVYDMRCSSRTVKTVNDGTPRATYEALYCAKMPMTDSPVGKWPFPRAHTEEASSSNHPFGLCLILAIHKGPGAVSISSTNSLLIRFCQVKGVR